MKPLFFLFFLFFSHEDTLNRLSGWYGGCPVIPEAPLCWQGPSGHSTLNVGPSTERNINTPAFYFTRTYPDTLRRPADPQLGTAAATVANRSKNITSLKPMISIAQWQSGCLKEGAFFFLVPCKHLFTNVLVGSFPDLMVYFTRQCLSLGK